MHYQDNAMFSKPSVFITGASGGIGKAVAERFCQCGAQMVLADLSLDSHDGTSITASV